MRARPTSRLPVRSAECELRNRYREAAGRACLLPLDLIIQPLIVLRRAGRRVGAARRRLVRHDGRPRAAEDTWSLVRRGSGGRIAIRAGWLTAASAIGELIVEPLGVRGDGGATRASETHAASVVGLAASQLPAEPFVVCDRGGVLSTQQHLHTSGKRRTRLLSTPVLCCWEMLLLLLRATTKLRIQPTRMPSTTCGRVRWSAERNGWRWR